MKHIMKTAAELEVRSAQVEAVGKLLEEGATVPFIARYRKEATGNLGSDYCYTRSFGAAESVG